MTLHVPAILFKAWPVLRVVVLVGLVLFLVQLSTTTVYDGVLHHALSDRSRLDKDLSQIQGTLDYLSGTSAEFLKDEQRLHSKFGLPVPDAESRELGTGGNIAPDTVLLRGNEMEVREVEAW
jgi:hypothetical protein